MCTLKNEHVPPNGNTRGYMYPQTEIWVGMLPTSEFDWLGMKEKTYLIALVCDLSNINMEKKNNDFTYLHFFFRSLLRQTKESENCLKKKQYSGKPYMVTSDWEKFQMKLHYKPCDEIFHRFKTSV